MWRGRDLAQLPTESKKCSAVKCIGGQTSQILTHKKSKLKQNQNIPPPPPKEKNQKKKTNPQNPKNRAQEVINFAHPNLEFQ